MDCIKLSWKLGWAYKSGEGKGHLFKCVQGITSAKVYWLGHSNEMRWCERIMGPLDCRSWQVDMLLDRLLKGMIKKMKGWIIEYLK